jgi:hypothetical protein
MKNTININIDVLPKELRLDTGINTDTGLPVYDVMYKDVMLEKKDAFKSTKDGDIYVQLANNDSGYLAFNGTKTSPSWIERVEWYVIDNDNEIIAIFETYEAAKELTNSDIEYKTISSVDYVWEDEQ